MSKKPKILCVCRYGHSRSVGLARVLHAHGYEAAAVGWFTAPAALAVLSAWADVIAVMDRAFAEKVPEAYRHKVTDHFHVGHDVWVNPYHKELEAILVDRHATFAHGAAS